MVAKCRQCEATLQPEWVACPYCGRATSGNPSTERIVRIVARIGSAIADAVLVHQAAEAEKRGDRVRAEELAIVRRLVKDIVPLVVDAVAEYTAHHPPADSVPVNDRPRLTGKVEA
jgi:hypothetical protein